MNSINEKTGIILMDAANELDMVACRISLAEEIHACGRDESFSEDAEMGLRLLLQSTRETICRISRDLVVCSRNLEIEKGEAEGGGRKKQGCEDGKIQKTEGSKT